MMDAPERVWVEFRDPFVDIARWHGDSGGTPYILDTPEALAKSPAVQALVKAARAEGMEKAADCVQAMAGDNPYRIVEAIRAKAAALSPAGEAAT